MAKSHPVVHFEMPAKDKKRVSDFYTNAFGWDMIHMGSDMSDYIVAQTAPTDEKGMVQKPGTINGGFFDYKDDDLNRAPHLVIAVDNLDESMKAVKDAGGKIMGEKMKIPGIGLYVSFQDTEDNVVGMLQPAPRNS